MGMNREQAINYLISSGFSEEQINEIAKALEPTTKNDLGVDKARNDSELIARGDVINMIKELPSVTPQERTGHWIEKDGFDGDTYYDCSECGESWTTIEGTPWDNEFKYCPNCGAKMVERQESEE